MSEPTLLEDLEEARKSCLYLAEEMSALPRQAELALAARLEAHAARLRSIFSDPRMVLAFETPDIMRDVFERINGGSK